MKSKSVTVHIRVPKPLHEELIRTHKQRRVSLNTLLINIIRDYYHSDEKETHEKATLVQHGVTLNRLNMLDTKTDLLLIIMEEVIKTYASKMHDSDEYNNFIARITKSMISDDSSILDLIK